MKSKDKKWWQISSCCRNDEYKQILHDIDFLAEPGELTGILGPSGCGKTTLVNILSCRIKKYEGSIYINDYETNIDIGKISGYVKQQDLLLASQTVKEVLSFHATLRLPASMSKQQKRARVDEIIKQLGLEKCANSRIGNEMERGVSGGELKRVSIGCELITRPQLLFLDEPTSGLDATTAYSLLLLLKRIAKEENCTIITTIHQPSALVYNLFDRIVLMESGEIIFQGSQADSFVFFEECGYTMPKFMNPAEFSLDVISESLPEEYRNEDSLSVREMAKKFKKSKFRKECLKSKPIDLPPVTIRDETKDRAGFFTQFSELSKRSLKEHFRNPAIFQAQFFQHVFLGLFLGLMFLRLDKKDSDTRRDRSGAIFFLMINATFAPAMAATFLIPKQRAIFNRERESGAYTILPHYLSTTLIGLPFQLLFTFSGVIIIYWMVGLNPKFDRFMMFLFLNFLLLLIAESIGVFVSTFCDAIDVATTITSLIIVVMMAFGGFLTRSDTLPKYFYPLDYISPYKYGYRAMLRFDMEPLDFPCQPTIGPCPIEMESSLNCTYPCFDTDGRSYLESIGLMESEIWIDVLILLGMLSLLKIASYFAIIFSKKVDQ